VVVYHLWPRAVPGGFAGVDVFFVISGFLITQQLAAEAATTGRVSLTRFWARRVRRILPAAFLVLLACVALVVWVMPTVTWPTNLSDVKAAAAYVINWQLGAHAVNYLASENSPTIVRHYWSLAVEEQFYLVWPLLVAGSVLLTRRLRRASPQRGITVTLAVVGIASLVTSVIWTTHNPAMAFYATPTRAWEFAAGGLVGMTWGRRAAIRGVAGALAAWAGLGVVTASMMLITGAAAWPGWLAIVPVGGTVLVLLANPAAEPGWSCGRLLGLRPVQWVGDVSYSLYLWHWPLIVAAPWLLGRSLTWATRLAVLVVALLLAGATKRLVEDPLRVRGFWLRRRWLSYGFAVAGAVGLVALSGRFDTEVVHADTVARAAAITQTRSLAAAPHKRSCFGAAAMVAVNHCTRPYAIPKHLDTAFAAQDGRSDPCLDSVDASIPSYCTLGDTSHPRKVVAVIGNSHAWRLAPALSLWGHRHHWEIIEAARINCLGLVLHAVSSTGATPSCLAWSAAVQRHLLSLPRLNGVIFASYRFWQEFTSGPNATASQVSATKRQIRAMWRRYRAHGTRVIVVQDVPGMRPQLDPECIARSHVTYDPCAVSRSRVVQPTVTTRLAHSHPTLASYVPTAQYFCDRTHCHGLIGGVVVYFDDHHMTTTFSRSLAPYLGPSLAAALQQRHG
jgi:peptidoglycan/LPS O-acetylase OafA/YrhL